MGLSASHSYCIGSQGVTYGGRWKARKYAEKRREETVLAVWDGQKRGSSVQMKGGDLKKGARIREKKSGSRGWAV